MSSVETPTAERTIDALLRAAPEAVLVLHRFGLDTCCSRKLPLGEACLKQGVPTAEVIAALSASGIGDAPAPAVSGHAPESSINTTDSIRTILAAHPQTRPIFQQYGLMNCGGAAGPDEALEFFARAHDVPLAELRQALEAAVHEPDSSRPAGPAPAEPARRFVPFLIAALVLTLTFGATLGMINLARLTAAWGWGALSPSSVWMHAYVQVFGFVGLFVMGVASHIMPRFSGVPLRAPRSMTWSFWLQLVGVISVVAGVLLPERVTQVFWLAGGLALLSAAVLFTRSIVLTLRSGTPAPERFERWVIAGSGWLVVASLIAVVAAANDDPTWHFVLWPVALFGFAGNWLFGVGRRILPLFLGLRVRQPGLETPTFLLYQMAVAGWSAGAWPIQDPMLTWLRGGGAIALTIAIAAYVTVIGILGRRRAFGRGTNTGFKPYIYAAFVWLLVGVATGPVWTLGALARGTYGSIVMLDFARHAIAFGFITQMIMGVASRVLPVFTGNPLWSPRARSATFYLLNGAVGIRALEAAVAAGVWPGAWPFIAASGPPAVVAVCLFAANVLMTLRIAPEVAPTQLADAKVEAILRIPGAVEVLISAGFTPLANPVMRATLAKSVTLRQACQLKGVELESLERQILELQASMLRPSPHVTVIPTVAVKRSGTSRY